MDKSKNEVVRYKAEPGVKYRLFYDDHISLGLSHEIQVQKCISEELPREDIPPKYVSLRHLPEGISSYISKELKNTEYQGPPSLTFKNQSGDEEEIEFDPKKVTTIGRQEDRDIIIKTGGVSRV